MSLFSIVEDKIIDKLEKEYLTITLPSPIESILTCVENKLFPLNPDTIAINKPIFIIGSHRSGTTILYESLSKHPELIYFTNASALFPKFPILNHKFTTLLGTDKARERFLKDGIYFSASTPSEGVRIWDFFIRNNPDHCLDETYENPKMDYYLKLMIQKHLKYLNGKRFISKNPDNSVRIRYLYKLFPDALFLHIIRDPRAVCCSYLKAQNRIRDFFGSQGPYADHGTKVRGWQEIQQQWYRDPLIGAGKLWCKIVETIEEDCQIIPNNQFYQIRFEDVAQYPMASFQKILRFCELPITPTIEAIFAEESKRISLGNRNENWQDLTNQQIRSLLEIIAPKILQYGYENKIG